MDGSEAERLEAVYSAQGWPAVLAAFALASLIYWLWARADRRRAAREAAAPKVEEPEEPEETGTAEPADFGLAPVATHEPW